MKTTEVEYVFNRVSFPPPEEDYDAVVLVTLSVIPGIPGRYSGPPEDCYPDEPAEWSIVSITGSDSGQPVELSPVELAVLEDRLSEEIDDLVDSARRDDDFNEPDEGNDHFDYPDCY